MFEKFINCNNEVLVEKITFKRYWTIVIVCASMFLCFSLASKHKLCVMRLTIVYLTIYFRFILLIMITVTLLLGPHNFCVKYNFIIFIF